MRQVFLFVGAGRRRRVKAESLDINSDGQRPSNQNAPPALSPAGAVSRFCPCRAWNMLSMLRRALPVAIDIKAFSLSLTAISILNYGWWERGFFNYELRITACRSVVFRSLVFFICWFWEMLYFCGVFKKNRKI